LNLIGTSGKDTLVGGAGNDFLNGLAGADLMIGHQGDDTYTVDTAKDVVTELVNEGIDTVNSSITYTLPANVENLVLTGSANRNGTGNAADNMLIGNAGRNTLKGAAGNDTYLLARGSGADKIQENDATAGNTDVALFGPYIMADQLWFQHRGRDLQVSVIGTSDKFTITNWFAGTQYHVEQFKTSDGKTLLDSQVQNLVDAMAGFAPPAAGQTTLLPNYQTQLGGIIAANWQ
jgi:Ca2+-binding RTX toxin-like protein